MQTGNIYFDSANVLQNTSFINSIVYPAIITNDIVFGPAIGSANGSINNS